MDGLVTISANTAMGVTTGSMSRMSVSSKTKPLRSFLLRQSVRFTLSLNLGRHANRGCSFSICLCKEISGRLDFRDMVYCMSRRTQTDLVTSSSLLHYKEDDAVFVCHLIPVTSISSLMIMYSSSGRSEQTSHSPARSHSVRATVPNLTRDTACIIPTHLVSNVSITKENE